MRLSIMVRLRVVLRRIRSVLEQASFWEGELLAYLRRHRDFAWIWRVGEALSRSFLSMQAAGVRLVLPIAWTWRRISLPSTLEGSIGEFLQNTSILLREASTPYRSILNTPSWILTGSCGLMAKSMSGRMLYLSPGRM